MHYPPRLQFVAFLLTLLGFIAGASGCSVLGGSPGGKINIFSLDAATPYRLNGSYPTAVYRALDQNRITIILSDLPLKDLVEGKYPEDGQVICIDMFWWPKAGATPIDPTSTNCSIRHVIFSHDAVGVYSGAGFMAPASRGFESTFGGDVEDATIRLADSSAGFVDRLGTAFFHGSFKAARNDQAVDQIAVQLNTELSRRFQRLYFIIGN